MKLNLLTDHKKIILKYVIFELFFSTPESSNNYIFDPAKILVMSDNKIEM